MKQTSLICILCRNNVSIFIRTFSDVSSFECFILCFRDDNVARICEQFSLSPLDQHRLQEWVCTLSWTFAAAWSALPYFCDWIIECCHKVKQFIIVMVISACYSYQSHILLLFIKYQNYNTGQVKKVQKFSHLCETHTDFHTCEKGKHENPKMVSCKVQMVHSDEERRSNGESNLL